MTQNDNSLPSPSSSSDKPILYFDGVCGLCNGFVDFVMARDHERRVRFATLQGSTAQTRLPSNLTQTLDTFVLQISEKTYLHSTAVLRALMEMGGVWKLSGVLLWIPAFIRDAIYRVVAHYRYRLFGKRQSCRIPTDEERSRFLD